MPSGRWPPLLLGIHTRRRGCGAYCPARSSSRSAPSQCSAHGRRSGRRSHDPPPPLPRWRGSGDRLPVRRLSADLVPEGVEAEGWFSLSFRLQRGLERLNRCSGVARLIVNHRAVGPSLAWIGAGLLPSTGVTRPRRYYEPIRHLPRPALALAGSPLAWRCRSTATSADFPCCALSMSRACCHHYPGGIVGCVSRSLPRRRRPSPLLWRVGSHIDDFEACSVFTRVAARTVR